MKYVYLFICVLSMNVFASDDTAVSALKQQLTHLRSFTAHFNQQVVDAQQQILDEAQGTLTLQQPNKLYWEVAEPNENILIADGDTLWHIDPFVEQVTAVEQQQAIQSNPMVLLADPESDAWSQYVISQQGQRFDITSKDETSQIAKLVLEFSQHQLTALHIHNRQQQVTTMQFSDIQQGIAVAEKTFVFKMPEGYSLDDQRRVTATGL